MNIKNFVDKVSKLKDSSVVISGQNIEEDFFSMLVTFSQGEALRTDYWRIIKDGRHLLSSFDHKQQYGLLAPINAIEKAKKELEGKTVSEAKFEKETGDIIFKFTDDLKLQVFNFTGYEVWGINFSDGTVEFSNYAREYE